MSLGKANYCLRALIAKEFVKAKNCRKNSNKLAYLYLLTPAEVVAKADMTRQFLARCWSNRWREVGLRSSPGICSCAPRPSGTQCSELPVYSPW